MVKKNTIDITPCGGGTCQFYDRRSPTATQGTICRGDSAFLSPRFPNTRAVNGTETLFPSLSNTQQCKAKQQRLLTTFLRTSVASAGKQFYSSSHTLALGLIS